MASVTAIQFQSKGVTCRGDLYLPDTAGRAPIMVMAHGLGGTRTVPYTHLTLPTNRQVLDS